MLQSFLYIDALFLLHNANVYIIDIRMAKIPFVATSTLGFTRNTKQKVSLLY